MKTIRWTAIASIALLVVSQAVRPAKTDPAVDQSKTIQAGTQLPADVGAILDRSCRDCHSSKTEWPWYSQIAPVSWYLVYDVNKARKALSFSEWGRYTPRRTARKLQEICEQLEKGEMPPWDYVLLYPTAKLSDSDKRTLCEWAKRERGRVPAAPAGTSR